MRIATWNCCGSFRTKYDRIASFDDEYGDDILVVQEAECIERLPEQLLERYPNHVWVGDSPSKGLLVLGSPRFRLEVAPEYSEEYRYVLPVRVTGECDFMLFAVWAQRSATEYYTDYLLNGLRRCEHLIRDELMVVGDFNSTPTVPAPRGASTHWDLVDWFADRGLVSAYHWMNAEQFGEEEVSTFAFRRDLDHVFHLDYLFTRPRNLRGSMGIGMSKEDMELSDHVPLFVSPGMRRTWLSRRWRWRTESPTIMRALSRSGICWPDTQFAEFRRNGWPKMSDPFGTTDPMAESDAGR